MRLITPTVYRAFPELDQYDNEQCERFVRAVRASMRGRLFRGLCVLLVLLVGVAVCGACAMYLQFIFRHRDPRIESDVQIVLKHVALMALGFVPPALLALLVRDAVLRLSVRSVLRGRAHCSACKYGLLGLPVSAQLHVLCPECGTLTEVDPSLGELVLAPDGSPSFAPNEIAVPGKLTFWTPARTRRFKRAGVAVGAILAVVVLGLGSYELFIRAQSRAARRFLAAMPDNRTLIASFSPNGGLTPGDDTWIAVMSAADQLDQTLGSFKRNLWTAELNGVLLGEPEPSYIWADENTWSPGSKQQYAASRAGALALLEQLQREGFFRSLSGAVAPRPGAASAGGGPARSGGSGVPTPMISGQSFRVWAMAQYEVARAFLALRDDKPEEFGQAFFEAARLVSMCEMQGTIAARIAAIRMRQDLLPVVMTALDRKPHAAWLQAMKPGLEALGESLPFAETLTIERCKVQVDLASIFAEPAQVRGGRFNPKIRQEYTWTGKGAPSIFAQKLGTFDANRALAEEFFADFANEAALTPPGRTVAFTKWTGANTGYLLLDSKLPFGYTRILDMHDLDTAMLRATAVAAALAQFRELQGDYPQSLALLVPDFLTTLPIDPWSGKPLCYARIDPETDAHGRSFLIYSVGYDGVDDGGRDGAHAPTAFGALVAQPVGGIDIVLNASVP